MPPHLLSKRAPFNSEAVTSGPDLLWGEMLEYMINEAVENGIIAFILRRLDYKTRDVILRLHRGLVRLHLE